MIVAAIAFHLKYRWSMISLAIMLFIIFFFQAEDGMRDIGVTGVQTCALPIYGAHQDLGLTLVAVVLEDGVVLVVHGDPAPVGEVRDVEHPVGEQIEVRLAVVGVVGAGGDELVDGAVFLVVAGVGDDPACLGDVHGHVLVPDAPEPGVLARRGLGVEGVYLDDPAVVLGGLGACGIVEPTVGLGDFEGLGGVVGALARLSLVVGALAVVVLEVLLAGEHGVPRRYAAATVGERPDDLALPLHLHLGGACGGPRPVPPGGRIPAAAMTLRFHP